MADYPSIAYTDQSRASIEDGRIVERTDAGTARARDLWGGTKRTWRLEHVVDTTDLGTLTDHHAAHLDASFSFTDHDSTTWTVIYGEAGIDIEYLGGGMHRVSIELAEV